MSHDSTVHSLWVGPRLTLMGQIAMRSFVAHGHRVELFTYGEVADVPRGVTVLDAAAILPADEVFAYGCGFGRGSYSAFSNIFRYKLLLDRGGWWVDADVVCLRPLAFEEDIVLASEIPYEGCGDVVASSCVIKQPAGSPLMEWAWHVCCKLDRASIRWGDTGPKLVQRGVEIFGWQHLVKPPHLFNPLAPSEWRRMLEPGSDPDTRDACTLHLWHQMWREHRADPDAVASDSTPYGRLLQRYAALS